MGFQIKRGWLALACFGFLCFLTGKGHFHSPAQLLMTPVAIAMEKLPSTVPSTPEQQVSTPQKTLTSSELEKAAVTVPKHIATFYIQHQWQPVWDKERLLSLLNEIRALKADGLDPDDYSLSELEDCLDKPACIHTAEHELLATRTYLLVLQHLYLGRVNPASLDPHWNFDTPPFETEKGIMLAREAVEKNHIDSAFQRARPGLPRYMQMRNALIRLYEQADQGGWPLLPDTPDQPSLKPGMTDNRIPLLRQRLQLAGLLNTKDSNNTLDLPAEKQNLAYFDSELENAVRRFQQSSLLEADGAVGKQTLQALNVPITERIGQLRVNLERMRWHLREISGDYVTVDVAGYNITYMHNGQVIWKSRVQVGKRYRKTPIIQSAINRITLNPQWTIPPTILRKDSLPAIRKNRDYLTKNHIRVLNKQGEPIAESDINWNDPGPIILRQDAGPGGALGQIAIRFPNDYSVYLHETPHQALFNAEQRSFSSGCIRVENVRELAVLLLNDEEKWNQQALEMALSNNKTREVNLSREIPILIDYWTVDVDEEGYISYRPDIYGRDKDVLTALDSPALTQ